MVLSVTARLAAGSPAAAPCTDCVVLALDAGPASRLAHSGAPLEGLDVVLSTAAASAAGDLAAAGARVWLDTPVSVEWSAPEALVHATGLVLTVPPEVPAVFAVQHAATAARAARPQAALVLRLSERLLDPAAARAVAPYVDAVLVPEPPTFEVVQVFAGLDIWVWSEARDPLDATAATGVTAVIITPEDAAAAAAFLSTVRGWLPPGLTPLPDVQVECDGCRTSVWLHPETLHAMAIVDGVAPGARVRIAPGARDVRMATLTGDARGAPLLPLERGSDTGAWVSPGASGRLVLDIAGWRGTDEEVYRTAVEVTAARTLTVGEIVARHQAQRARQQAVVRSVIAAGTTVLSFEVPGFPAPVSVTADTTIYTRGPVTEIAQASIRVNGADMTLDGRAPRLPIVDAERVSTPPLTITLTAAYEYRLHGREDRGGRSTYVVGFSPVLDDEPGFRGRAWIDADTFALVRMEASQTGLRGPIVSAEQHDEYVPVRVGEREVWLQGRSSSYQIYQAAGLRTPIHREVVTPVLEVNPADFDSRLADAYASRAVMLRDTPMGYRYLVPAPGEPAAPRVLAETAGQRVVSLAFGMLLDPNISVPLPYAGVSYLDFDFLDRGIQFSGFFGGAYGQLAWTVPGVLRPGWQLTGRAFGIAASYNDRAFEDGLEQYDENIRQRPFRTSVALVAPFSARAQLRLGYEFEYTAFRRSDDTAPSFVVPAAGLVHGLRVGLDVQRGPWSALLWWNPARRQGWRAWGYGGGEEERIVAFQRYGATIARSWVLGPGSMARVEAQWMDGRRLDRFSRYTFDSLENRLRGYPSAALRYDRGAVLRSVATWAPAARLRLDGFADYAVVRDPGFGDRVRSYPGIGVAAELPLPRRMLVAVEWGYGLEARNRDGSRGTHVVRLSGLKVF